jgi:hypothetical protein
LEDKEMRAVLLAVALLFAASTTGHSAIEDEVLFASKDCSSVIGQDGNTFTLYTELFHGAEYIPAAKVVHVDADTLSYEGVTFEPFERNANCG